MEEIRTATTSVAVFPSTNTVNTKLLRVASRVMCMSEAEAAEKLQEKLMLPVRKPAKGMALVVGYQYIKRVVGHLNSSLSSISVTTFVKRTHAIKGIGSWSSPSPSSNRRVLRQSPGECRDLLRSDAFITDASGRLAMLDALASVIDELGGTDLMVSWTGPNKATRVIRCLFGHFANVSFRVRSLLLLLTSFCPERPLAGPSRPLGCCIPFKMTTAADVDSSTCTRVPHVTWSGLPCSVPLFLIHCRCARTYVSGRASRPSPPAPAR